MKTKFDPDRRHRRSIRLKGYDYRAAGAYFVTICTHYGQCLFGDVVDGTMVLNQYGKIVRDEWFRTAVDDVGAHSRAPLPRAPLHRPPRSLGAIIAGFKSAVTRRINTLRDTPGVPVWQRNYYEHVIRDDASLHRIRRYIAENPLRWHLDRENPDRVAEDELWEEIMATWQESERNG